MIKSITNKLRIVSFADKDIDNDVVTIKNKVHALVVYSNPLTMQIESYLKLDPITNYFH